MVARFHAAPPGGLHRLSLGRAAEASGDLASSVDHALGAEPPAGPLRLESHDWRLTQADLTLLEGRLNRAGLVLDALVADDGLTRVAATARGWPLLPMVAAAAEPPARDLLIHRGTLRAGEHLDAEGAVLVVGDVNPGARVSAGGDVLVFGRLRGIAHAGRDGARDARIVALQLRPLQLRIAAAVARGPEDTPAEGQAEEATLVDGEIRIRPARLGLPIMAGPAPAPPAGRQRP